MIENFSKKHLASEHLFFQIIGATIKKWWLSLTLIIVASMPLYCCYVVVENQYYQFAVLSIALLLAISVCNTLTNIFSLRRQEAGITWCQITILFSIGVWIISLLLIFNITDKTINAATFGIAGSLMAWIFQDTIRGVVAFIHLRMNHLLQIDDWIKVPKYDINGKVIHVTLTTVTIYNWDTTTSSIPTCVLLSDHFVNLQKMAEGKTYGRMMRQSFIMDISSFYALSEKNAEKLKADERITNYLPQEEIRKDLTNAQLYRKYLYHWLMKNPHISQQPCLTVSWQEHTESGITLKMTCFIIDSNMSAFEWQKSLVIEHVMQSLSWFGLRLYQSPSSFDSSSSTIYISDKPLTNRVED